MNSEATNKNPFDGYKTNSFTSGSSTDQTAWFGYKAGGDNGLTCDDDCPYHTAIGNFAMNNVIDSYSTALGQGALRYGTSSSTYLTAIGVEALARATGRDNVAVGVSAHGRVVAEAIVLLWAIMLYRTRLRTYNVAIGYQAQRESTGSITFH